MSKRGPLPYYKRYPRDFYNDTIGMEWRAKSIYGLVIDLIYMRDGALPNDSRYIAGMIGCSVKLWNNVRDELIKLGKLKLENEIISNFRADYELQETRKFQDKQAENRANPNKNNEQQSPNDDHTESEAESEDSTNVESDPPPKKPEPKPKASPKGTARGSQLPQGWSPGPVGYAYASDKGLTPEEANDELEKFTNYHRAKGTIFKDWGAGWRTWCGNAAKWKRERAQSQHNRQDDGGGDAFDRLDRRLAAIAGGREAGDHHEPGRESGEPVTGELLLGTG